MSPYAAIAKVQPRQTISPTSDGGSAPMPIIRHHLYAQVWTRPTLAVAKEYDVSADFLARVCASLSMPDPPRGYWAKVAAGQKSRRATLPPNRPGDQMEWEKGSRLDVPLCRATRRPPTEQEGNCCEDRPLGPHDYVLSPDEKTSIQARKRRHAPAPVAPGHPQRVEHAYRRHPGMATLATLEHYLLAFQHRCQVVTGNERRQCHQDEQEFTNRGRVSSGESLWWRSVSWSCRERWRQPRRSVP